MLYCRFVSRSIIFHGASSLWSALLVTVLPLEDSGRLWLPLPSAAGAESPWAVCTIAISVKHHLLPLESALQLRAPLFPDQLLTHSELTSLFSLKYEFPCSCNYSLSIPLIIFTLIYCFTEHLSCVLHQVLCFVCSASVRPGLGLLSLRPMHKLHCSLHMHFVGPRLIYQIP